MKLQEVAEQTGAGAVDQSTVWDIDAGDPAKLQVTAEPADSRSPAKPSALAQIKA